MNTSTREKRRDAALGAAGALLFCGSIIARTLSYPAQTSDYRFFVARWFNELATHAGLSAFQTGFADYAPAYLYFLKALTYLPVSSLYGAKALSGIFDVVIATLAVFILQDLKPNLSRARLFFAFAATFSIPTLVLNSALWAQCDAMYASGVLAATYFMLKDKPLFASIAYGFAGSFKVQSVFFLPIFLGYALSKKRGWKYLAVLSAVFALSIFPAIMAGGSLSYWGLIYLKESSEFAALTDNAPSIFAFFQNAQNDAGVLGITAAALAGAGIAYLVLRARKESDFVAKLLRLSLLSAISLPFFLPHMHERYFYLADVFSTLLALSEPRRWYLPALVVSSSLLSYVPYLAQSDAAFAPFVVDLRVPAALMLAALAIASKPFIALRFPQVFAKRARA